MLDFLRYYLLRFQRYWSAAAYWFTMRSPSDCIKGFIKAVGVCVCVCLLSFSGGFEGVIFQSSTAIASPNWTYKNETGPNYWSSLDTSFTACSSGLSQSPIDLTLAIATDLPNPDFHYEPVPLNLLNNGHTVQVPYAPGSYMLLDGQQYNLLQFHFHSPSEHALDGKIQSAELHLVHQSESGELAVVAVMLQPDESLDESDQATIAFSILSGNLPEKAGDKIRTGKMINAQTLLPSKATTYRYSGSLTTPPCTESVTWLVMTEPVTLSVQQLAEYERLLHNNHRPLQRLNQRAIQLDTSL